MSHGFEQEQVNYFFAKFGAGWCSCMSTALEQLTPQLLSAYCQRQRYKPYPAPIFDKVDGSTRYQYLVAEKEYIDKGQRKVALIVAGFGDFPGHAYSTMDTCLTAVLKIASATGKTPDLIAAEILKGEYDGTASSATDQPFTQPGFDWTAHGESSVVRRTGVDDSSSDWADDD